MVARLVLGVTQQELAQRADISRATIAQIETGYSDPRLSTIVDLAGALGIPPIVLLTGSEDVRALVNLLELVSAPESDLQSAVPVPQTEVERMQRFLRSGMLKDRLRAARIGAAVARAAGAGSASEVCSAIFSAVLPGQGTVLGMQLGRVISECQSCSNDKG